MRKESWTERIKGAGTGDEAVPAPMGNAEFGVRSAEFLYFRNNHMTRVTRRLSSRQDTSGK